MQSASRASARATTTPTRSSGSAARVPVVAAYIPFSTQRKAETASYAKRHYGVASWHLRPSMVVLHFTETTTMSSARNTFAQDVPNTGELPGTCAHFIVDQDGRVYAIVPVTVLCRHTIGLNDKAIGIEMVQSTSGNSAHWADQQILARRAQITSVLRLVHQLQAQWGIPTSRVIGHAMANDDPAFHDLRGWHNDHSDWQAADVMEVRRRLAAM
ncbi:N-acetylmuramoyl-L-alanine amidase [Oryzihumus leptocrescens]|uniref:N-acetylmuramoyl-L-alanine amidase n=2 Tax=Oryzihumus leptocrescens TaxID=297536 RepID=A0A542ZFD0_9MICO|nr:N-acetylmuramoyl-L-alanine amidase [Oryzihumus leptocrescens]